MSIARISAVTVAFIVAIYTLSASPLAGPLTPGAKMSGADTVYGPGSTWTPPKTCSAWFMHNPEWRVSQVRSRSRQLYANRRLEGQRRQNFQRGGAVGSGLRTAADRLRAVLCCVRRTIISLERSGLSEPANPTV
jgi:hypothetical protein